MVKEIVKKIGQIVKENIGLIFSFIVLFIIFTFELPYYVEIPGGIINTSDRIKIESEIKKEGSFNLAYVGEIRGTIATLLITKLNKDWEAIKKEEVILENETENDLNFRNRLMLDEANNNAIKLAYKKAGKKYQILNNKLYVTYIDKTAKTDLKIKDIIVSIDGKKIKDKTEMNNIIQTKNVGDRLTIEVKNENKNYKRYAIINNYGNIKKIGIVMTEKQKLKTDPNISFTFKKSESGPSGGLMMTLSIYNKLTEENLTKSRVIVGTGTIDEEGNVGEIDGIKYKLMGAVKNHADVFLVPSGNNYKDAIKVKKEKKYKIKIVKVNNLDEAIEYLKK